MGGGSNDSALRAKLQFVAATGRRAGKRMFCGADANRVVRREWDRPSFWMRTGSFMRRKLGPELGPGQSRVGNSECVSNAPFVPISGLLAGMGSAAVLLLERDNGAARTIRGR